MITVILSIIYIALQWFISFIYLNFFNAAGLGFGVGGGVFIAVGSGKIRNTKYECVLAVVCGLLAWYSQWALFVSLMSEAQGSMGGGMWVRSSFNLTGFWYIFTHPEILFQAMLRLNDVTGKLAVAELLDLESYRKQLGQVGVTRKLLWEEYIIGSTHLFALIKAIASALKRSK